jgi:hypothetical protein
VQADKGRKRKSVAYSSTLKMEAVKVGKLLPEDSTLQYKYSYPSPEDSYRAGQSPKRQAGKIIHQRTWNAMDK